MRIVEKPGPFQASLQVVAVGFGGSEFRSQARQKPSDHRRSLLESCCRAEAVIAIRAMLPQWRREMQSLQAEIDQVRQIAETYQGQGLTEQDTKNAIIEPILAALGWPKRDLTRVRAGYRRTWKSDAIDYALFSEEEPVLFIEARALDRPIEDAAFVAQVLTYSSVAGVSWAILTNGWRWDFYSVLAQTQIEKRRIFSVALNEPACAEWLSWLSLAHLKGDRLENFRRRVRAERAVREAVMQLFEEPDEFFLDLLAEKTGLPATDVALVLPGFQPSAYETPIEELLNEVRSAPVAAGAESSRSVRTTMSYPPAASTPSHSSHSHRGSDSGLPTPLSGLKPTQLTIEDTSYAVRTWREMLVAAVRHFHQKDPTRYKLLFTDPEFAGRKRRTFDRNREHLRHPGEIPGGYAELNWSAINSVAVVEQLVRFFNVPTSSVSYETR